MCWGSKILRLVDDWEAFHVKLEAAPTLFLLEHKWLFFVLLFFHSLFHSPKISVISISRWLWTIGMKAANFLSLVLFVVSPAQCSDILAATMPQGKSHAGSMVPLLAELARQGNLLEIFPEFRKIAIFWFLIFRLHSDRQSSGVWHKYIQ